MAGVYPPLLYTPKPRKPPTPETLYPFIIPPHWSPPPAPPLDIKMYGLELRIVSGSVGAVVPIPTLPVAGKVFCAIALIAVNGTASKTRLARVCIPRNPRFPITLYPPLLLQRDCFGSPDANRVGVSLRGPVHTVERRGSSPVQFRLPQQRSR